MIKMIQFNSHLSCFKTQLWLLMLSFLYCSGTLLAELNVSVEIQGVNNVIEKNIREFLSIEQQKSHALLSEGRLRYLHKKAEKEIEKALQPYGYYRPDIKTQLITSAKNQWLARYTVNAGPPIRIADFNFTVSEKIKNDPKFKSLLKSMTMQAGEAFSHLKYEELKKDYASLAAERGYFKAQFVKHRVEINLKTYQVRVELNFDGGVRYKFGEVILRQSVLEPEFLQKYVNFKRGQPYDQNKLIALQQTLNDSDYFSRVEVSPGIPDDISNEVSINVILTPRKKHRYTAGVGYGTDTGARAKFGWEIPRFNNRGHRLNTEAKVSEIGYSLGTQYRVPVLNPRTDQMIYSAGIVNQKTTSNESTISTIGGSLNHSIGNWREIIALNYQQEKYIVAGDQGLSKLLMPSITLSRVWGRNSIYTLDGLRFDINLRAANDKLLSDTSFIQAQSGIKAITSIGKYDRIIARGRLGAIDTNDFHQLPSSVRFYAGGAQSVRGYAYQSLGPVDSTGKVVGGQYLMIGSLEYEHSLSEKWGAAIFYDAGNAYDQIDDKLQHGAGFGIRWKSPIGPVRFDFASAISQTKKPWRLHINIGPDL